MGKFILSAFGDEAATDLAGQMDILDECGIRSIELRGVWGKNVLALDDSDVMRVKREMADRGFSVSALGSPIGKVPIDGDWEKHKGEFRRMVDIAGMLQTKYIRIFSFYLPKSEDPARYRDTVISRMAYFAEEAGKAGIMAVHENESDIYGDIPERCLDIIESVGSPHLRAVFDPANFVVQGVKPFDGAFGLLRSHIEYLHIKDAILGTGKIVPAGEGDGQVKQVLSALNAGGFTGFLTLEPHLSMSGRFSGFSGPDLFKVAAKALKGILNDIGALYE